MLLNYSFFFEKNMNNLTILFQNLINIPKMKKNLHQINIHKKDVNKI